MPKISDVKQVIAWIEETADSMYNLQETLLEIKEVEAVLNIEIPSEVIEFSKDLEMYGETLNSLITLKDNLRQKYLSEK